MLQEGIFNLFQKSTHYTKNYDKQTQVLVAEIVAYQKLQVELGGGAMSVAAYDTAWVARVRDRYSPQEKLAFPLSFEWLLTHQEVDGRWEGGNGSGDTEYSILPTLAGLLALLKAPIAYQSQKTHSAVLHAQTFLKKALSNWAIGNHESVGFEVLAPRLLEELEQLGVAFEFAGRTELLRIYDQKLSLSGPEMIYNGKSNLIHSLEAFGPNLDYHKLKSQQASNGSYGCSPAATAAVLIYAQEWDIAAENWLKHLTAQTFDFDDEKGGMPNAYPIDAFEAGWVLYNLGQTFELTQLIEPAYLHNITDWLYSSLTPQGASIAKAIGLPPDSDDTGMVIAALNLAGVGQVPLESLWSFERDKHFACFHGERGMSLSANAHVLAALTSLPASRQTEPEIATRIDKLVKYLLSVRELGGYWTDKWHVSPYYATACSILALTENFQSELRGWQNDLGEKLQSTVQWLLQTQSTLDGGWGIGNSSSDYKSTLEETAYAIQCLHHLRFLVDKPKSEDCERAIGRGIGYLLFNLNETTQLQNLEMSNHSADSGTRYQNQAQFPSHLLPKLWRGKELYAPKRVILSAVLSALWLSMED